MNAPTTALVEILHRHAPAELERLRAAHHGSTSLFERGVVLGDSQDGDEAALRALASTALEVAFERGRAVWTRLQDKVARTLKLRLVAGTLSALTSGGVVGLLFLGHNAAALISAVLAFSSAALTLLAQYVEDLAGGGASPRAMKDRLSGLLADAAFLEGELALAAVRAVSGEALAELVRRANSLVAEVRKIEFQTGLGR